jgi:hypothetical protein
MPVAQVGWRRGQEGECLLVCGWAVSAAREEHEEAQLDVELLHLTFIDIDYYATHLSILIVMLFAMYNES